jgi:hypothetical protein
MHPITKSQKILELLELIHRQTSAIATGWDGSGLPPRISWEAILEFSPLTEEEAEETTDILLRAELIDLVEGDDSYAINPAGEEYMNMLAPVPTEHLLFLPWAFPGVRARATLAQIGDDFLRIFTEEIAQGSGIDFVSSLQLPETTAEIDQELVLRFYASTSALLTRVENGMPPANLAEALLFLEIGAWWYYWSREAARHEYMVEGEFQEVEAAFRPGFIDALWKHESLASMLLEQIVKEDRQPRLGLGSEWQDPESWFSSSAFDHGPRLLALA